MRAFVSFATTIPVESDPPGLQIASALSDMLEAGGERHESPRERKGRAWGVEGDRAGAVVESILAATDDGSGRWLVGTGVRRRGLAAMRPRIQPEQEEALRAWCVVLYRALRTDERFADVRWLPPASWGREDDGWAA